MIAKRILKRGGCCWLSESSCLLIGSFKYDCIAKNNEVHDNNLFFINIAAIGNDCATIPEASERALAGTCLYLLIMLVHYSWYHCVDIKVIISLSKKNYTYGTTKSSLITLGAIVSDIYYWIIDKQYCFKSNQTSVKYIYCWGINTFFNGSANSKTMVLTISLSLMN